MPESSKPCNSFWVGKNTKMHRLLFMAKFTAIQVSLAFWCKNFCKKKCIWQTFYPKWPYCLSRDDVWLQERLSVKTTQFKSAPHISYCILWDQKTWEIMHKSYGCFLNCPFVEKSCIQMSFLVLCGKTWQHGFGMTYGGVNNDSSFIFVWTTLLNCAMSCLLRGKA